ncbi:Glutamate synthase [NADPH] large chain [Bacillus thermotolerans]|uniref:Glutamate synthase [NADPH] large chain n=1 Tax=Bacillus thermotolerans TaxID=1221996 RepID=A0A0F5HQG7_BACTR|nr:Glutamate synthase [NADPH] large chain [Bacillus thermotolerans]
MPIGLCLHLINEVKKTDGFIYMDYASPSTQYAFDVNKSPLFRKGSKNYINVLGIKQLNTLENVSLLDIFLSTHNVVEPHYHQNAAELVYCISGVATVSMLNPFIKQILNFPITPGQAANVPQGWWHYEMATVDTITLGSQIATIQQTGQYC